MQSKIIKLYGAYSLSLILVSGILAHDALTLKTFIQILLACVCLIGGAFFVHRLCAKISLSLVLLVVILVVLPLVPYLKFVFWIIGFTGVIQIIKISDKVNKRDFYALPIVLLVILSSGIYADFEYENKLASGKMAIDTLFHADIAAMYLHNGVASIGMNGLVPILYHTLSHKMMAGVSLISGLEVLATYSYIYLALAPLLLIFSLASLTCKINEKVQFSASLLGIASIFLTIIFFEIFSRVAMWDSFFISESYLFALVFFSYSISSLIDWDKKSRYFDLLLALGLVVLSALTKGSVGVLGLIMFGFLGLSRYKSIGYWGTLVVAGIIVYFAMHSVATNMQQYSPIAFFGFINSYVNVPYASSIGGKLIFFVLFHFLFIWCCFFIGFRCAGYSYIRSLEFQIISAIFLPAFVIALVYDFGGGAGYYFSSVPVVIAFAFFSSHISPVMRRVKFVHIIIIVLIGFRFLYPVINSRSFLFKDDKYSQSAELKTIIKQLQSVRDDAPKNSMVKVLNSENLQRIVGCNAYWMIPAVMEHPVVDGLPDTELCPQYSTTQKGTYGLSEYYVEYNQKTNSNTLLLRLGQ